MKYQKTQAHRQKVKQRTEKRNERVVPQNLREMALDISDGKMVSALYTGIIHQTHNNSIFIENIEYGSVERRHSRLLNITDYNNVN